MSLGYNIFLRWAGIILVVAMSQATQGAGRRSVPAIDLQVGFGMSTYKSKLVASSNTSNSNGYSLGVWGGEDRNFNMTLAVDSNKTSFEYAKVTTESSISVGIQDVLFRYRLGPMYLGAVFAQTSFTSVKEDVEYLDGISTGSGFNLGFNVNLRRGNTLYLDFVNVGTSVTKDTKQEASSAVAVGARTEFHVGGKIKLTRSLMDLIIGYKSRSFSIEVSGTSYEEALTTTWIGLGFNLYF